jgi:hypothetical protein
MRARPAQIVMIVAMAMLYALIALPLPYLLVDHYSAVQAGDPDHNEADVHVWLEWAAGSSLSGAGLILPSVLSPSMLPTIPSPFSRSTRFGLISSHRSDRPAARWSR